MSEQTRDLTEFIKEAFGSNATYVQGLLVRYKSDPKLVDESWQTYFGDLLAGKSGADTNGTAQAAQTAPAEPAPAKPAKQPAPLQLPPDTASKAITGSAKKIVENMEQSLTVPTATSFRNVPVKLLEENRRIINEHLAARGRGKVS
ncbi:MAG: multifunctional oxoglutarate decarboxylase/oxoglutarate dehydrogenase thiamine pyrophosphate-binding subunit/dihydrolipoyllysine-residue succinyltransferase subunit, partial [Pyrinomonadaceae bacterium]